MLLPCTLYLKYRQVHGVILYDITRSIIYDIFVDTRRGKRLTSPCDVRRIVDADIDRIALL